MTEEQIKKHIATALKFKSETTTVEFKTGAGGLTADIWKVISAFAHHPNGGCIVFGVKEETTTKTLKVVGTDQIALLQEKIANITSSEMSIVIRPDYFPIELEGKQVLAVYIPECPDQFKPCYYTPVGLPNGAYIRSANTNRKITDTEMRQFLDNAKLSKFDTAEAPDTTISDLSEERILELLARMGHKTGRKIKSQKITFSLLKNLGLADKFGSTEAPTMGGFLLFATDKPQIKRSFNRYIIRCVRYKGSNVTTPIIDKSDITGTLDEQIDGMQKFILRNIPMNAHIEGTKRIEMYEYPESAIREIVANAVIHRDYRITETYTQVNIFEDRLEIFNPGCLPPGVTTDNIRDAQVSRNEVIAARLKDLDYLEEYGRGIDIVFSEMEKWNLLPPIFKNTTNSFKVILPGHKLSGLNQRQLQIWDHLLDHKKITALVCQDLFRNVSRPTLNSDLSKMQELGLIHSVGASINTHYEPNF